VTQRLEQIPEAAWRLARKRERVLASLIKREHLRPQQVERACTQLGLKSAMLFRLVARYREDPRTSTLLLKTPGRKSGSRVLDKRQEEIIHSSIERFYLRPERPSLAALHREIIFHCSKARLPFPSYNAVQRRVATYNPRKALTKRSGMKEARQQVIPVKGTLTAERPLDLVQIDHTLVDVVVVDEWKRQPIGRPWITLAIDVATRMVLGFHLSLEAPGATSVALTLNRVVLPKEDYLCQLRVQVEWPTQGLPKRLHLDNAKEFHSRALKRGCEEYGIEIVYRPPGRPHYGGHIERLIGTMMGEVHLLPGTTFSSVRERGHYDPTGRAVMTLRELESWLALQIAGVYHHTVHRGLKQAPIGAWRQAITKSKNIVRLPRRPDQFYVDFLPYETRAVRREGIRLFSIFYWADSLSTLLGKSKRQQVVHYDPRNLSQVYVKDAHGELIRVPYRSRANPAITLEEHRLAVRQLGESKSPINEEQIFRTIEEKRQIVVRAQKQTMRMRRSAQKTQYALQTEHNRMTTPQVQEPEETGPIEPFPIEVWNE
jgi:putative transposase